MAGGVPAVAQLSDIACSPAVSAYARDSAGAVTAADNSLETRGRPALGSPPVASAVTGLMTIEVSADPLSPLKLHTDGSGELVLLLPDGHNKHVHGTWTATAKGHSRHYESQILALARDELDATGPFSKWLSVEAKTDILEFYSQRGIQMAELGCNKRFHPKGNKHGPDFYWFFCRLEAGHAGSCDCPAAHEGPGTWEN